MKRSLTLLLIVAFLFFSTTRHSFACGWVCVSNGGGGENCGCSDNPHIWQVDGASVTGASGAVDQVDFGAVYQQAATAGWTPPSPAFVEAALATPPGVDVVAPEFAPVVSWETEPQAVRDTFTAAYGDQAREQWNHEHAWAVQTGQWGGADPNSQEFQKFWEWRGSPDGSIIAEMPPTVDQTGGKSLSGVDTEVPLDLPAGFENTNATTHVYIAGYGWVRPEQAAKFYEGKTCSVNSAGGLCCENACGNQTTVSIETWAQLQPTFTGPVALFNCIAGDADCVSREQSEQAAQLGNLATIPGAIGSSLNVTVGILQDNGLTSTNFVHTLTNDADVRDYVESSKKIDQIKNQCTGGSCDQQATLDIQSYEAHLDYLGCRSNVASCTNTSSVARLLEEQDQAWEAQVASTMANCVATGGDSETCSDKAQAIRSPAQTLIEQCEKNSCFLSAESLRNIHSGSALVQRAINTGRTQGAQIRNETTRFNEATAAIQEKTQKYNDSLQKLQSSIDTYESQCAGKAGSSRCNELYQEITTQLQQSRTAATELLIVTANPPACPQNQDCSEQKNQILALNQSANDTLNSLTGIQSNLAQPSTTSSPATSPSAPHSSPSNERATPPKIDTSSIPSAADNGQRYIQANLDQYRTLSRSGNSEAGNVYLDNALSTFVDECGGDEQKENCSRIYSALAEEAPLFIHAISKEDASQLSRDELRAFLDPELNDAYAQARDSYTTYDFSPAPLGFLNVGYANATQEIRQIITSRFDTASPNQVDAIYDQVLEQVKKDSAEQYVFDYVISSSVKNPSESARWFSLTAQNSHPYCRENPKACQEIVLTTIEKISDPTTTAHAVQQLSWYQNAAANEISSDLASCTTMFGNNVDRFQSCLATRAESIQTPGLTGAGYERALDQACGEGAELRNNEFCSKNEELFVQNWEQTLPNLEQFATSTQNLIHQYDEYYQVFRDEIDENANANASVFGCISSSICVVFSPEHPAGQIDTLANIGRNYQLSPSEVQELSAQARGESQSENPVIQYWFEREGQMLTDIDPKEPGDQMALIIRDASNRPTSVVAVNFTPEHNYLGVNTSSLSDLSNMTREQLVEYYRQNQGLSDSEIAALIDPIFESFTPTQIYSTNTEALQLPETNPLLPANTNKDVFFTPEEPVFPSNQSATQPQSAEITEVVYLNRENPLLQPNYDNPLLNHLPSTPNARAPLNAPSPSSTNIISAPSATILYGYSIQESDFLPNYSSSEKTWNSIQTAYQNTSQDWYDFTHNTDSDLVGFGAGDLLEIVPNALLDTSRLLLGANPEGALEAAKLASQGLGEQIIAPIYNTTVTTSSVINNEALARSTAPRGPTANSFLPNRVEPTITLNESLAAAFLVPAFATGVAEDVARMSTSEVNRCFHSGFQSEDCANAETGDFFTYGIQAINVSTQVISSTMLPLQVTATAIDGGILRLAGFGFQEFVFEEQAGRGITNVLSVFCDPSQKNNPNDPCNATASLIGNTILGEQVGDIANLGPTMDFWSQSNTNTQSPSLVTTTAANVIPEVLEFKTPSLAETVGTEVQDSLSSPLRESITLAEIYDDARLLGLTIVEDRNLNGGFQLINQKGDQIARLIPTIADINNTTPSPYTLVLANNSVLPVVAAAGSGISVEASQFSPKLVSMVLNTQPVAMNDSANSLGEVPLEDTNNTPLPQAQPETTAEPPNPNTAETLPNNPTAPLPTRPALATTEQVEETKQALKDAVAELTIVTPETLAGVVANLPDYAAARIEVTEGSVDQTRRPIEVKRSLDPQVVAKEVQNIQKVSELPREIRLALLSKIASSGTMPDLSAFQNDQGEGIPPANALFEQWQQAAQNGTLPPTILTTIFGQKSVSTKTSFEEAEISLRTQLAAKINTGDQTQRAVAAMRAAIDPNTVKTTSVEEKKKALSQALSGFLLVDNNGVPLSAEQIAATFTKALEPSGNIPKQISDILTAFHDQQLTNLKTEIKTLENQSISSSEFLTKYFSILENWNGVLLNTSYDRSLQVLSRKTLVQNLRSDLIDALVNNKPDPLLATPTKFDQLRRDLFANSNTPPPLLVLILTRNPDPKQYMNQAPLEISRNQLGVLMTLLFDYKPETNIRAFQGLDPQYSRDNLAIFANSQAIGPDELFATDNYMTKSAGNFYIVYTDPQTKKISLIPPIYNPEVDPPTDSTLGTTNDPTNSQTGSPEQNIVSQITSWFSRVGKQGIDALRRYWQSQQILHIVPPALNPFRNQVAFLDAQDAAQKIQQLAEIVPNSNVAPAGVLARLTEDQINDLRQNGAAEQYYGTAENPAHNFRVIFKALPAEKVRLLQAKINLFFEAHPEYGTIFRINNNSLESDLESDGHIIGIIETQSNEEFARVVASLNAIVAEVEVAARNEDVGTPQEISEENDHIAFALSEAPAIGISLRNINGFLVVDSISPTGLTHISWFEKLWLKHQITVDPDKIYWITTDTLRPIDSDQIGYRDEFIDHENRQLAQIPKAKVPRGGFIVVNPAKFPSDIVLIDSPSEVMTPIGNSQFLTRLRTLAQPIRSFGTQVYSVRTRVAATKYDFSGLSQLVNAGFSDVATYIAQYMVAQSAAHTNAPSVISTAGDSLETVDLLDEDFNEISYIKSAVQRAAYAANTFIDTLRKIASELGVDVNLIDEHFYGVKSVVVIATQDITTTAFSNGTLSVEEGILAEIGETLELKAKTGGFNFALALDHELSPEEIAEAFDGHPYIVEVMNVKGIDLYVYRVQTSRTAMETGFLNTIEANNDLDQDELFGLFEAAESQIAVRIVDEQQGLEPPIMSEADNAVLGLAKIVYVTTNAKSFDKNTLIDALYYNFGTKTREWLAVVSEWWEVMNEYEEYINQVKDSQDIEIFKLEKNNASQEEIDQTKRIQQENIASIRDGAEKQILQAPKGAEILKVFKAFYFNESP